MNNQLIKELAEKAGYFPDMFGIGHWDMPECKAFVKLIVQECAVVADKNSPLSYPDHGIKIKRHFGVD